jgi:uncharacterized protein (TIGR02757 family)
MARMRANIQPDLKSFLDEKYLLYNNRSFIETDPISIPHLFTKKEDIEIAGLLAATIAWGQRKSIISNANKLVIWMDNSPHEFILNYSEKELSPFKTFVHRTFNGDDCVFFIRSLRNIYKNHDGLENIFAKGLHREDTNIENAILSFRTTFLEIKHLQRSEKHISNPLAKSSAKRLCMYLRWMVRKDNKGVDFGIWKSIIPSQLCLPLDVHTGNVSRKLGLLKRQQNDWRAVEEITNVLKQFDPKDPVKYDFALFGLGAFEGFK